MIKIMVFLQSLSLIFVGTATLHRPYNYTYWGEIASAESMHLLRVIDNSNVVDINDARNPIVFGDIRDVFVYENHLYISDATAHKIYIFNSDFQFVKSLPESTDTLGQLNAPQGLYVHNHELYVADYNNKRVAIFDLNTDQLVREVKNPEDVIFDSLEFRPLRIAVDRTGRMNIIAFNVFEGVMEFDESGTFNRYFGTNTIQFSFLDALIYRFSTREQREQMALNLQSSFTSLDIDGDGYIYTVSRSEYWQPVKRLNFKGRNVLQNRGLVGVLGDVNTQSTDTRTEIGPSQIIDISVHESMERYSILDQNRGRIFTYDKEGHLLYVSGGKGNLQSQLAGPTALTYFNEFIVVTDNISKSIKIFEPTEFASLVNTAISFYNEMDYDRAKESWEEVLKLNSNYFLAYAGIGRAQLRQGLYKDAMANFELGYDYFNYSKAYERHRNEQLAIFLPYVLVAGLAVMGFVIVRSVILAVKREGDD